jgi:hypothetical protein
MPKIDSGEMKKVKMERPRRLELNLGSLKNPPKIPWQAGQAMEVQ